MSADNNPTPLLHYLLIKKHLPNLVLRIINQFYYFKKSYAIPATTPKKIILSNIAHLGDIVISTSVLALIKENYPEVQVGFICGSWSKEILINHPLINKVHIVDHWKLNRSGKNIVSKLSQYSKTYKKALVEIKEENYDIAIDLYSYFPNTIPLLAKAKIPIRIGYISGGFSNLLTHPIKWENKNQSVGHYHIDLLKNLPRLSIANSFLPKPLLFPISSNAEQELQKILQQKQINDYIVFHVGSGLLLKEWPSKKWRELVRHFTSLKYKIIFTGTGKREKELIQEITNGFENCLDLSDRLNFFMFFSCIQKTKLLICVDSLAGHIAANYDTPCITLGNGMNNPHHWRPVSHNNHLLIHNVPCSPCYKSKGCKEMSCVKEVEVGEVIKLAQKLILNNN